MPRVVGDYLRAAELTPLFIEGSSLDILARLPASSIDCVMTSPPYWGQRQYAREGLGLETTSAAYIERLVAICGELVRVLKPTGSFWLNLGDTYVRKSLAGIPWRVAIRLTDEQGWTLRNSVVWSKLKGGPDQSRDKLRNVHEPVFHFVKSPRGYFYDVDAIRSGPRRARVVNGTLVSATGVSGVRYRGQIERSAALSAHEKRRAMGALEEILREIADGRLADFRMIIRGEQRATHSSSERVSGRARELRERGYYFLRYHPDGSKPGDVWDILPEDTQKREAHFASYPEDLCRIPLLATCPEGGVALDPFCGTGTTNLVARSLGRRSIGIDLCPEYLDLATERCAARR